jgi:multidrug efflux pump subunit AcrB
MVLVTAGLAQGADLGRVTAEVRRRLAGLDPPPGYRVEVGGQAESARRTQLDLATTLGLGIVLVLVALLVQLRSLRLALVVLLGAPLALVAAGVALVVTAIPLNASSLMGCILLVGLVVKNGILLLEHAQRLVADGAPFREAVAAAGERRLRPILMTTAATVAGLLPLALGLGAGAELQRPLAVATIGGLLLSTMVTLLVLPALASAVMPAGRR